MNKTFYKLEFKRFKKKDFEAYKSWFSNINIKAALYDIDEEWLDFVLADQTGIEYAVFLKDKMVAVVGIDLSTKDNPSYVIKNIAIEPTRMRQGLGSSVLKELVNLHPLEENESWIAYVEEKNTTALHFFDNNGWKKKKKEDEMIKFEYPIFK